MPSSARVAKAGANHKTVSQKYFIFRPQNKATAPSGERNSFPLGRVGSFRARVWDILAVRKHLRGPPVVCSAGFSPSERDKPSTWDGLKPGLQTAAEQRINFVHFVPF